MIDRVAKPACVALRVAAIALTTCVASSVITAAGAHAHGTAKRGIEVDHAYALPAGAESGYGSVFFRSIRNRGDRDDRLIAARSPVADAVIFRVRSADDPAHIETVDGIPFPVGVKRPMRHRDHHQLRLEGLKGPLVVGERFPLTLHFAHAGEIEVSVWVQAPDDTAH